MDSFRFALLTPLQLHQGKPGQAFAISRLVLITLYSATRVCGAFPTLCQANFQPQVGPWPMALPRTHTRPIPRQHLCLSTFVQ